MPPSRRAPTLLSLAVAAVATIAAAAAAAAPEPIVISTPTDRPAYGPVVAALPDGGFAVAWVWYGTSGLGEIRLRTLDAAGVPRGPEQTVASGIVATSVHFPRLAVADDGTILVAFQYRRYTFFVISARRYSPQGLPLDEGNFVAGRGPGEIGVHVATALPGGGWLVAFEVHSLDGATPNRIEAARLFADGTFAEGPFLLTPDDGENRSLPVLARTEDGLVGAWTRGSAVAIERLDAVGAPVGEEEVLSLGDDPLSTETSPLVATYGEGRGEAIWIATDPTTGTAILRGRRLEGGIPTGSARALATLPAPSYVSALAADGLGRFFVGWSQPGDSTAPASMKFVVQGFGREGAPLASARTLVDASGGAAVAMQPTGAHLLAWAGTSTGQSAILGEIGALANGCAASTTALCLTGGRFRVEATWDDGRGHRGMGQAVPLAGETGAFWFFDSGNLEVVVKVLDACSLAGFGNYWVFAAGLTNVEVDLTVTDTETGEVWRDVNEQGVPFQPVQDTAAFFTCR